MSLPIKDPNGRIFAVSNGTPATRNAGIAYDSTGRMCTTTATNASDVYVGGWRLDQQGRVVVADGTPPRRPYIYNGGLPFSKLDGSLIRQENQAPDATDPYVAGVRVGPLGGVYTSNAAVPTPPTNSVPPTITGVPQSSNTLTCNPGTWSGQTSIAFRWLRNNVPMIGETNSTFTVVSTYIGDQISCAVTASNTTGPTTVMSNSVTIIP